MGHILLRPIKRSFLARKMSQISQTYNAIKTNDVGIVAPADSRIEEAIPSSCFDKYVIFMFEDAKVMAIADYDLYLKGAYGDYMQLPSPDKRVSLHKIIEMDLDY